MFNKKFKLLATMVGLVAVLMVGLVVPGVTQQIEMPTRGQIVKGLNQLIATLTASEGDILDPDNLVFASHPEFTFGYIPLLGSSRSILPLYRWIKEGEPFGDSLNLGSFYTEQYLPCQPGYDSLKAGVYNLKVNKDLRLIAVDSEGNEFLIGHVYRKRVETSSPALDTYAVPCPTCIGALAVCVTTAIAGNNLCVKVRICLPQWLGGGCFEIEQCMGCAD